MPVDDGLAPREDTPGAHLLIGTCLACPGFPEGHPLVGDPSAHLVEAGVRVDDDEGAE